MRYDVLGVIIFLAIAAYFLFFNKSSTFMSQSTTVLPTGTQGLIAVKQQHSSELPQARSFCTGQFKGEWVETSNEIGCFNMQGFSSAYCLVGQVQDIINDCKAIGGTPVCTSTQASCSV